MPTSSGHDYRRSIPCTKSHDTVDDKPANIVKQRSNHPPLQPPATTGLATPATGARIDPLVISI